MKRSKRASAKLQSIYPLDVSSRSPRHIKVQESSLSTTLKPNINSTKNELFINLANIDNQPSSVAQLITQAKTLSVLSPSQRKDKFGIPIIRGKKLHSVSFNPNLNQVIEIENWKIHNVLTIEDEPICPCQLL